MTAPDPRLGEIEDRLSRATPGPWYWRNTGAPMLMGARTRLVMAFSRMGMNGAQPEFRDWDGLMVKAGKENINTYPDAEFIAAAPADVAYLLAELRKAQDALGRVEGLAGPGEQEKLATVIAAAEGWERQDLTTDVFADYLQTAAEVLAAGFRKVEQ